MPTTKRIPRIPRAAFEVPNIKKIQTIPEKLRYVMLEQGLNQVQLAELLGVSQTTVSKWLMGQMPLSKDHAFLIQAKLKYPADWLLGLGPAPSNPNAAPADVLNYGRWMAALPHDVRIVIRTLGDVLACPQGHQVMRNRIRRQWDTLASIAKIPTKDTPDNHPDSAT